MNKGEAILHAIITALTVCLMTLVVVGIVFLLCFVLRDYPLLTAALMLAILAVIVGISSYRYFRKKEE